MIAASLGYDHDIPVSDITINQKRFGIELATPLHKIDKGIIKVSSPANHLNVIVKFRENKYSSPISFRAKAYIPPIPNLPQHLLRIRLKTAFFDLMIGFGDNTSTYQMSIGNEKHSVNDLLNQARLMQWMCFDKSDILLDVELEGNPEVKVSLSIKQKADALHSEVESWKGEVENIERIYWITSKFKLNDILRFSINDTYSNREKIENFYNIYHIALGDMRLTYGVDGEGYEPEAIKKHCATYVFHLWLGGMLIATILTITGTPEKASESEYNLLITERIIEKELVSIDNLDDFRQHLRDEVSAINKKNHDMGYIVLNRV
ncbi:hypothetical protein IBT49_02590 [Erwinia sp. S63]|uniref:hypothetical protein n=1 Tax=Erwinia sp. S63 TaxID=2769341 RepID=UPI001909D34D|nr:hypothetical protein [Erwinia sp. S63]MBK0094847.1 hypothetical protein [Erwinia sp. S63]